MIQELPPKACFDLREADPSIPLIDVRTAPEFAAGHPLGAQNVPVGLPGPGGLSLNPAFVDEVSALVDDPAQRVILSCAVGARSLQACRLLEAAGYGQLINLTGGFNGARDAGGALVAPGWRDQGLPEERA